MDKVLIKVLNLSIEIFPLNSNNFGGVKNADNAQYKMLDTEGRNGKKRS